jgi:heterodisulfide reductase subunit D
VTQTDPDQHAGDALTRPFTPGAQDNDPALAAFPETVTGPVPVEIQDRETAEFVRTWRNASYNCFSSGHKFCREVCPVMQVTRNESWTPTAFHADVVAMERGEL